MPRWNWQMHGLPSKAWAGMGQRLVTLAGRLDRLLEAGLDRALGAPAEALGCAGGIQDGPLDLPLPRGSEVGLEVVAPGGAADQLDQAQHARLDAGPNVDRAGVAARLGREQ